MEQEGIDRKPLVSVCMTTYYHEKYVSQAIESVLAQKVDFPIQIAISDDGSHDKTVNIIQDYASKYDFIKIKTNKENIGLTANLFQARCMCDGKYITFLSGDDYWIDEDKLAKQVKFLENRKEYFGVCCRLEMRPDNETKSIAIYPEDSLVGREITEKMFLCGKNMPMNGMMMHNPYKDSEEVKWFSIMPKVSHYIDDLTDNFLILRKGRIFIQPDVMVAYRTRVNITDDKNFNSLNKELDSFRKHIELLNNLDKQLYSEVDFIVRYRIVLSGGVKQAVALHKMRDFWTVYKTIPEHYRKRGLLLRCIARVPSSMRRQAKMLLTGYRKG